MQVLPRTAKGEFGINAHSLWDPVVNIHVGAAYLRLLANRYPGRTPDVIAAYNAGPGRHERNPSLPRETRRYRRCVSRWHALYARGAGIRPKARKTGAVR
jgi:soluble lytic murein transglycosylase-like protein